MGQRREEKAFYTVGGERKPRLGAIDSSSQVVLSRYESL